MLRKSREKSEESPSLSAGRKRKVSFATNRIEIEPEMTERDLENLTLSERIVRQNRIENNEVTQISRQNISPNRILRQKRIEINQSAGQEIDQSERASADSESCDNNSTDNFYAAAAMSRDPIKLRAPTKTAQRRRSSTESARLARERYKKERFRHSTVNRYMGDIGELSYDSLANIGETNIGETNIGETDISTTNTRKANTEQLNDSEMPNLKQTPSKRPAGEFECHVCGEKFSQKINRQRHLAKHGVNEKGEKLTPSEQQRLLGYNKHKNRNCLLYTSPSPRD